MQAFLLVGLATLLVTGCGGTTAGPATRGGSGGADAGTREGTGGMPDPDVPRSCRLNSDCDAPLVCKFAVCHEECAAAVDCPEGRRCVAVEGGHACQLVAESACLHNSDCAAPLVCAVDRQCRTSCVADRDCVEGEVCATSKVCASPDELDASGDLTPP